MTNISTIIDDSLLSSALSFLKKNPQLILVRDANYNLIYPYSRISNQIQVKDFSSHRHLISLYHTQKKINDYSSKVINGIKIAEKSQAAFFKHWMEELPSQYYSELFKIAGKIIPLSIRLSVLSDNLPLFIQQFTSPKHNSVSIPSNKELQNVFSIVNTYIKDKKTCLDSIFNYCVHHSIVFKRIEAQSILYDFLHSYYQQEENYETIIKQFAPYLKNINPEQDYFAEQKPCFFFSLNKKQIFQKIYHQKITQHYTIIEFMLKLAVFFNQKHILEQCHLSSVYVVDTETEKSHVGWVFHQKEQDSTINYKSLLMFLLEQGSVHIGDVFMQEDWNKHFETIFNYYFLSLELPEKEEISTYRKI